MSKAKWKSNKRLKPEVILQKIESIKRVNPDDTISYDGVAYHDAIAALPSMIDYPRNLSSDIRDDITKLAVRRTAKRGKLNCQSVLKEVNQIIAENSATMETEYRMLTSLSMRSPYPNKTLNIEGVKIRFFLGEYPKKYRGRNDLIRRHSKLVTDGPTSYAKIIASTKEKSERAATTKILKSLDIMRAVYCLLVNDSMEIIGHEWRPINKVRLGGAHSIHDINGKIFENCLSYEPNYIQADPHSFREVKKTKNNVKHILERLYNSSYSRILENSLLRFVRALDEKDQNTALIKLWGALEAIAAPYENNYDKMINRCAFLYEECEYNRQILEHIREARNQSVHAGDQNEKSKTLCYQLQGYYSKIFLFHLKNKFKSFAEANLFLDMPVSGADLLSKRNLIDRAIKFRQVGD